METEDRYGCFGKNSIILEYNIVKTDDHNFDCRGANWVGFEEPSAQGMKYLETFLILR